MMFLRFFALNFSVVTVSQSVIIFLMNGTDNQYPWNMLSVMVFVSVFIFILQYPLLKLINSWLYRTFVFYLSMNVFLLSYGIVQSLIMMNRKELSDNFEDGLKMIILGQIAGIIFLPVIVLVNWIARKSTLDNPVAVSVKQD